MDECYYCWDVIIAEEEEEVVGVVYQIYYSRYNH